MYIIIFNMQLIHITTDSTLQISYGIPYQYKKREGEINKSKHDEEHRGETNTKEKIQSDNKILLTVGMI